MTKITKGYSIVNSSNSSAVTKSRVDLSHHDHYHCSKSNADVSISSCIGHYDHDKFSSNGKANINLKQKFKRSSKKQRNQCKIWKKYSSHPNKNNKVFNCQDPNCMETFSKKHLLNLHLKRKHSNLSIVCTHCGKSFARSDVLLKHVRNIH